MNTSKQVNVMIGLLFVFLIGTLLYFLWETARAGEAQERQQVENAERGGALFANNCRACHGIKGGGGPNLPGPPLNLEANRTTDPGKLQELQSRFMDTIHCGRVGTVMPSWSVDQGGPLNDFQIQQLVALITGSMPELDPTGNPNAVSEKGWEEALREAEHLDLLEGRKLAEDVSADDDVLFLTNAQEFLVDSLLRIDDEVVRITDAPSSGPLEKAISADDTELSVKLAGDLFKKGDIVQVEKERMRVEAAKDDTLTVERGVDGTDAAKHDKTAKVFEPGKEITVERAAFDTEAAEHDKGAQVYAGPLEPADSITGATGTPPCGQLPPQTSGGGGGTPVPVEAGFAMTLGDNFFEANGQQAPVLQVTPGQEVTLEIASNGTVPHNMHIAGDDNEYGEALCTAGGGEPCSDPANIPAGGTASITFTFAKAGTFDFRCDFHPTQMTGQILVQQ